MIHLRVDPRRRGGMPPRFDRSRLWGRGLAGAGLLGFGGCGSGAGRPVGGAWLARGTTPEAGVTWCRACPGGGGEIGVVVACDRNREAMAGVGGSRLFEFRWVAGLARDAICVCRTWLFGVGVLGRRFPEVETGAGAFWRSLVLLSPLFFAAFA